MRAAKPREPPVHDRGCTRILGGRRRLAFDEIEQRRIEELRSPVAAMADKGVPRDSNEPRQRVVRNPFRRPTADGPHPGVLHEILSQADVAPDSARHVRVERFHGAPIGLDQVLFGRLLAHTVIDASARGKPTKNLPARFDLRFVPSLAAVCRCRCSEKAREHARAVT
jgi:hypothetical protein